jgi:hypothetical protein
MGTEYITGPFTLEFDGEGGAEFVAGRTGAAPPCTGTDCRWERKDDCWWYRCCTRPTGERCCQRMFLDPYCVPKEQSS